MLLISCAPTNAKQSTTSPQQPSKSTPSPQHPCLTAIRVSDDGVTAHRPTSGQPPHSQSAIGTRQVIVRLHAAPRPSMPTTPSHQPSHGKISGSRHALNQLRNHKHRAERYVATTAPWLTAIVVSDKCVTAHRPITTTSMPQGHGSLRQRLRIAPLAAT